MSDTQWMNVNYTLFWARIYLNITYIYIVHLSLQLSSYIAVLCYIHKQYSNVGETQALLMNK